MDIKTLKGDIIIFDKQGPMGNFFKGIFKDTNLNLVHLKDVESVKKLVLTESKYDFLFLLYIFTDEIELLEYVRLVPLGIPIIFGPTRKYIYKQMAGIEEVKIISLAQNKENYVPEIFDLVQLYSTKNSVRTFALDGE